MLRFTSNEGPAKKQDVIHAYLEEAKAYARAGVKPPKDDSALDLPDELVQALDDDPVLAEAFHALTRGSAKELRDQSQQRKEVRDQGKPDPEVP